MKKQTYFILVVIILSFINCSSTKNDVGVKSEFDGQSYQQNLAVTNNVTPEVALNSLIEKYGKKRGNEVWNGILRQGIKIDQLLDTLGTPDFKNDVYLKSGQEQWYYETRSVNGRKLIGKNKIIVYQDRTSKKILYVDIEKGLLTKWSYK